MRTTTAARWRLLALLTTGSAIAALAVAAGAALPLPAHAGDLARWYAAVGPAAAVAAVVRAAAGLTAAWLAACAGLQLLATVRPLAALRPLADRIAPAAVRQLASGVTTASLSIGLLVGPGSGEPPTPPVAAEAEPSAGAGTATMARLDPAAGRPAGPEDDVEDHAADVPSTVPRSTTSTAPPRTSPPTTVPPTTTTAPASTTTTVLPPTPEPPAPAVPSVPAPPPPSSPPGPAPTPTPGERSVEVAPGDSLWSIAEAAVRAGDPQASLRAVAAYWREVVELNRPTLRDPGNPDLIYPGQRVRLP